MSWMRTRMVPQKLNSGDDAVLTERKSTHAMIAGRTQPARALIALNHRRILSMVATVHHFLKLSPHRLCTCSLRELQACIVNAANRTVRGDSTCQHEDRHQNHHRDCGQLRRNNRVEPQTKLRGCAYGPGSPDLLRTCCSECRLQDSRVKTCG